MFWIEGDFKQGILGNTYGKAYISLAILENNIFKIDHDGNVDINSGLTILRTENGFEYDGSMKYMDDKKHSAIVNLKYYTNQNKVLLIGTSIEVGIKYDCIVELEEIT